MPVEPDPPDTASPGSPGRRRTGTGSHTGGTGTGTGSRTGSTGSTHTGGSAPRTGGRTARGVRAAARAALTAEIKQVARRQLADGGAAGLSLRAVARELGMVSSAIYRYFASRDELLTALIVDAYDDLGAAVEKAVPTSGSFDERFAGLASAVRRWATTNPHDYALVYGSPVPGYRAPVETVPAAARAALVALRLVEEGVRSGEIEHRPGDTVPEAVHRDLASLRELVPGLPDDVLLRMLAAWSELFGAVSLELFGHLHNVIADHETYFDLQMRAAARMVRATGGAERGTPTVVPRPGSLGDGDRGAAGSRSSGIVGR